MDGCCAKDFGNFRDEHIWVYDHQPKNEALADHGYVHVSHKQYFCTQGDETTPEYKPAVVAPGDHEGTAPFVVDPRGEKFMTKFPKLADDPGRERWLSSGANRAQKGSKDPNDRLLYGGWNSENG